MPEQWRDARSVHLITRGNVDGLTASALFLAAHPRSRVTYVPSAGAAADALRRDLTARRFYVVDLGLTNRLAKAVNGKARLGQAVTLIDHHQQTGHHAHELQGHAEVVLREGPSAAAVALDHFRATGLLAPSAAQVRLAALADVADYCESPYLVVAAGRWGLPRLEAESRILDFAWRLRIDDDRFRHTAARRLAAGAWPSEVEAVVRRYRTVVREDRWRRATARAAAHMDVVNGVAVLEFGKRRTSLLGFGSRALAEAARGHGCRMAVLVNRRRSLSSVSVRATGPVQANLGRFVDDFTREHGVAGGGHPESAGARVHTRHLGALLDGLCALG